MKIAVEERERDNDAKGGTSGKKAKRKLKYDTHKSRGGGNDAPSADAKGPMGPVFSQFVFEEESGNELKMDAIHAFAREGEVENYERYFTINQSNYTCSK